MLGEQLLDAVGGAVEGQQMRLYRVVIAWLLLVVVD